MSGRLNALKLVLGSQLASGAAACATGVLRLMLIAALLAAVAGLAIDGALADNYGNTEGNGSGAGAGGAGTPAVERAVEIEIAESTVSLPPDRDATLDLPFTARDRHGYRTLPPGQLEITVTGPDGEPVDKERIAVSQPRDEDSRIRITVIEAEQPLAPGRYTVRAEYGELLAEVHFYIAGPPETVKLRVDANTSYYVRGSVLTVTATVLDANDAIVPDGQEVAFTVEGELEVRNVASYTDKTTTSGKASARYIITGREGTATFSAKAGEASSSVLVELGAFPPTFSSVASAEAEAEAEPEAEPEPATGKAGLSSTAPGLSRWTSTAETTASALYAELAPDGLLNLWMQTQSTWLFYGLDNGALVPGSVDFTIRQGAILYLFYPDNP